MGRTRLATVQAVGLRDTKKAEFHLMKTVPETDIRLTPAEVQKAKNRLKRKRFTTNSYVGVFDRVSFGQYPDPDKVKGLLTFNEYWVILDKYIAFMKANLQKKSTNPRKKKRK